jgi:hypothetical protein
LSRERLRTKWVNITGLGVTPEYQGKGANAVLYAEIVRLAQAFPSFEQADVVQVEEGNVRMMANMAAIDVPWYKRHRIFRRDL